MELNDMDRSSKLYVGQTMKLPGKISKGEFKQPVKKSDVKRSDTIKYTVERGDSLSKIARMHSMKTSELKELNNLSSDFIREGQQLDVHKPKCHIAKGASTDVKKCVLDADGLYVIQQGDSLDRIARSFGVSSKALKEANGIDDPLKLQIGKKLIIPSKSHVSGPTIQQGGTATVSKGAGSGASGAAQSNADSDDFFETFDSIKVFEVGN
jgi:LysM repeat protein